MIPFFGAETYSILGLTFRVWGTLVALGIIISAYVAWRRAKSHKLDAAKIWDLAFWVLVSAIIGARLFHVIFYDWPHFAARPWDIVNPWLPGYAMFGAWLGGAAAFLVFVRKRHLNFLAYADAIAFALPIGIGIGRIGCFLIHDHPGLVTTFFLGIRYSDGLIRHDLGLYLSLIGFATALLFWLVDRITHPVPPLSGRVAETLPLIRGSRRGFGPGFWLGLFMLIEGLTRFGLDFLRVADARWFGLTPTQWLSIPLVVGGAILAGRALRQRK